MVAAGTEAALDVARTELVVEAEPVAVGTEAELKEPLSVGRSGQGIMVALPCLDCQALVVFGTLEDCLLHHELDRCCYSRSFARFLTKGLKEQQGCPLRLDLMKDSSCWSSMDAAAEDSVQYRVGPSLD